MATAPPEISPEISRFDAENATTMAAEFLKRLGYRGSWLPMKVSLDGELYIVEMMFQKLNAKVQINFKTKEIKEYEFQKSEEENSGFFSKGKIMIIAIIIPVAVVLMKLMNVF